MDRIFTILLKNDSFNPFRSVYVLDFIRFGSHLWTGNRKGIKMQMQMQMTNVECSSEQRISAPIMIMVADNDALSARAARNAEASGIRFGAAVAPEKAWERLQQQVSLDAVWLDWESCAHNAALPAVLNWLATDELGADARLIVSLRFDQLDDALACLPREATILCNADDLDHVVALSALSASPPKMLNDIGAEHKVEQLSMISEEVQRIGRVLASLSNNNVTNPAAASDLAATGFAPSPFLPSAIEEGAPITGQEIRHLIRIRRVRNQFFNGELFADPAWDMLLDLMAAKLEQKRVAVSSLCIAADVPATTALRWIKTMADNGLFRRIADPTDGRRIFIELSETAFSAMKEYFRAVGRLSRFGA